MNPIVRSRSMVMRSTRATPGWRLSFMSHPLLALVARCRLVGRGKCPRFAARSNHRQGRPMKSRRAVLAALMAFATAHMPTAALAQAPYPNQTIRLVVPYPAGGLPDTVARIVGKRLQDRLGQNVVIENRSGGAGAVAASALATAPA